MNSILNKLNIKEINYGSCIGGSNWLSTSDAGEIISINPTTNFFEFCVASSREIFRSLEILEVFILPLITTCKKIFA